MTTDCMRSAASPRLCAIAGNAVLTIVESSVCMKKLADTSHSSGCSECCGSVAPLASATGAFRLIPQPDQFLHQAVAVITLDFNVAVFHGAAGAAQLFQ